jgi:hypothetical protein
MTPEPLLRMSLCLAVPRDLVGEVGVMRFDPGLCAVSRFACPTAAGSTALAA